MVDRPLPVRLAAPAWMSGDRPLGRTTGWLASSRHAVCHGSTGGNRHSKQRRVKRAITCLRSPRLLQVGTTSDQHVEQAVRSARPVQVVDRLLSQRRPRGRVMTSGRRGGALTVGADVAAMGVDDRTGDVRPLPLPPLWDVGAGGVDAVEALEDALQQFRGDAFAGEPVRRGRFLRNCCRLIGLLAKRGSGFLRSLWHGVVTRRSCSRPTVWRLDLSASMA
jgi:hypothetical protein